MTIHIGGAAAALLVGTLALVLAPAAEARPAKAASITPEQVEAAQFKPKALRRGRASPLALKVQVMLDRAHVSPGAIDGVYGEGLMKAIRNFQAMNGDKPTGRLTQADWDKLTAAAGDAPVLKEYKLEKRDVKGPFVEHIPDDYAEKAEMKRLAYTSAEEALAEKFHMDEAFLKSLNPGRSFDKAGDTVIVVDPGERMKTDVDRIEVDGRSGIVRAYDRGGKVIAAYPASVGSRDMPSPTGSLKVRAVAGNPVFHYDPTKLNFPEVDIKENLKIAGGPNNPVGTIWIGLDKQTYGIHGTPEPSSVGKASSHGCVRLTNWDAEELAPQVRKGTRVDFVNALAAR